MSERTFKVCYGRKPRPRQVMVRDVDTLACISLALLWILDVVGIWSAIVLFACTAVVARVVESLFPILDEIHRLVDSFTLAKQLVPPVHEKV